ncbi:receptor-type tyrosine-protein phosphatase F-like isoform X2 [Convolutriloba macropyga]|uniref:receptor-type tyrosine-protein phosphatase F-like isoform X2 n=1 Tax=Convolutriloba macropyga TaxID=536237 RepID=UPI003F51AE5E
MRQLWSGGGSGIPLLFLWLSVLLIPNISLSNGELTFLERPKDTTVNRSSEVYFVCRFGGVNPNMASQYEFQWFKGNETIYDVTRVPEMPSVSTVKLIRYDTASSSSITCRVNAPSGKHISHTCQLYVLPNTNSQTGLPSISMVTGPYKTMQVNTVRQPIRVEVRPKDTLNEFRWFKDHIPLELYPDSDNYIRYTNGSIEIRKVTDGASGGYSLQVTNGAGTALSTEVRIYARTRTYAPSFIKPYLPNQVVLKRGQTTSLNCSANAAPVPKIRWYRKIGDFETIVPSSELYEQNYRTTYYIRDVQQNQTVKCKVTSGSHSPIEKSVNIIVLEPPAAPITLETDADIHTAQLRWTVPTPAPLSCTVFFLNLTESEDSRGSGRVVSWIRQEAQGLSSTQLKGLAPYSQYQVKVACSNDVGMGANSSSREMKTGEFTPSFPVNLHAEYKNVENVDIVQITWDRPLQPNGIISYYNFYYTDVIKRNDDISRWQKRITKLLYHPQKFDPGKTMVARAQAVNGYGASELSPVYTFPTTPGVPGLLERFNVEVISSNAVNLSWSQVALINIKDIKSYRVYYNDSQSRGTTRTQEISPIEVSYAYDRRYYVTIRGLQPDTKYSFTAAAVNFDDVSGPFTENMFCSTFKAETISAPVIRSIDVINSTSVRLHWKVPSEYDNIEDNLKIGFQISYSYKKEVTGQTIKALFDCMGHSLSSCILTGLKPDTSYAFQLSILLVSNESPKSNTYNIRTKSPEPNTPYDLHVEVKKEKGVVLSWDYTEVPGHPVTSFIVKYHIKETDELYEYVHDIRSIRSEMTKKRVEFPNLRKGLQYDFRVQARNLNGFSLDSQKLTVAVPATDPEGPPLNVRAVGISESRIFVSWEPPAADLQNGLIQKYLVTFSQVDRGYSQTQEAAADMPRTVIRNLIPDNEYSIQVQAKNSAGIGPMSEGIQVRTSTLNSTVAPKVEEVSISKLIHTTLLLLHISATWLHVPNGL